MALKLTVDKIDEVEEPHRSLYEEKDGKFFLSVDGIEDATATAVRAAVTKANKEAQRAREQLKTWERLGKTHDELQTALDRLEELEQLNLQGEGKLDALKQQLLERSEEKIKKAERERDAAMAEAANERAQREQNLLISTITSGIAAAKGKVKALRPAVMERVRVEHENGQIKFVVHEYGDKDTQSYNDKGDPMSIADLLAEMAQDPEYAGNFEGSGNAGGGARPSSGSGARKGLPDITKKSDFPKGEAYGKKFDEFIKAYPTPEAGLKAYDELPD